MASRDEVVDFLDDVLRTPQECRDVSNNGLQVEGKACVESVLFAVDASLAFFEQASAQGADMLVVHHGISWGDGLRYLSGMHARRLRILFQHDISLYASHLPLDVNPEFGNNAVLASLFGLKEPALFFPCGGIDVGLHGVLSAPVGLSAFVDSVGVKLGCKPQVLSSGPERVRHVGVVSGSGGDAVHLCKELGIDCLLTGEVGHVHVHVAAELGVNVVAAGHYCTEVCGIKALMLKMREALKLNCDFVDIPTGY